MWETFFKDLTDGKPLNKEAYIEANKKNVKSEHFRSLVYEVFRLWFASIDANEDGIIQEEEFVRFFKAIDLDSDSAKLTFQSLDSNQDGLVSLDEYVTAGMDFITSEDESTPGKLFWGPLVD